MKTTDPAQTKRPVKVNGYSQHTRNQRRLKRWTEAIDRQEQHLSLTHKQKLAKCYDRPGCSTGEVRKLTRELKRAR